jgi:hypothetical protein
MTLRTASRPASRPAEKSTRAKKSSPAAKRATTPAKKKLARPRFNLSLLRRVRARILAHPERYDQSTFCGTAYCIAGHAIMEGGTKEQQKLFRRQIKAYAERRDWYEDEIEVDFEARKLLRLTPQQSERLFSGDFPDELAEAENSSWPTQKDYAKVGAARIDLFISSKGRK